MSKLEAVTDTDLIKTFERVVRGGFDSFTIQGAEGYYGAIELQDEVLRRLNERTERSRREQQLQQRLDKADQDLTALRNAVTMAEFRVEASLPEGTATLWCKKCGRDSGLHRVSCPRLPIAEGLPVSPPWIVSLKEELVGRRVNAERTGATHPDPWDRARAQTRKEAYDWVLQLIADLEKKKGDRARTDDHPVFLLLEKGWWQGEDGLWRDASIPKGTVSTGVSFQKALSLEENRQTRARTFATKEERETLLKELTHFSKDFILSNEQNRLAGRLLEQIPALVDRIEQLEETKVDPQAFIHMSRMLDRLGPLVTAVSVWRHTTDVSLTPSRLKAIVDAYDAVFSQKGSTP